MNPQNSILAAIGLAILAAGLKYATDLFLSRRRDRLDRVNAQLRDFYGPLYAVTLKSDAAWRAFRTLFWSERSAFFTAASISEQNVDLWRTWITDVALPLNESIVAILHGHIDLLRGNPGEPAFERKVRNIRQFIQHVAEYQSMSKLWNASAPVAATIDELHNRYISVTLFPDEFFDDIKDGFLEARVEQQRLIRFLQDRTFAVRQPSEGVRQTVDAAFATAK